MFRREQILCGCTSIPKLGMSKPAGDQLWFSLPRNIQKVGLALFCPITKQTKGYPFEVIIPEGLGVQGVILSDQVKSLDWRARKAGLLCHLPPESFNEVVGKLSTLIQSL